jgi:hypothetical protein
LKLGLGALLLVDFGNKQAAARCGRPSSNDIPRPPRDDSPTALPDAAGEFVAAHDVAELG